MRDLFYFDIETAGNYKNYQEFNISDPRGSEIFNKKFLKMKWDDKYDSIDEAYLDNSPIISTFGKIVCISCGYIHDDGSFRISSFYGKDEKDIVNSFNELLKKIETKNFNLSGFRILYFDIPWVLHKLHKYGIEPADIIYCYNKKPWEMRITDMADDWKSRFAWSSSFDELTYELNINSPKKNMDGSEVHGAFHSGRIEDIKNYCELDVRACIEVSEKIYRK